MVGGVSSSVVSTGVGTSRYWYGLPSGPSGQNAFQRQFDASQYLNTLFFPSQQQQLQSLTDPSAYVGTEALATLKELFTPIALRDGDPVDPTTEILNSVVWPTQWPANVPQGESSAAGLVSGTELVGQILNILA